MIGTDMPNEAAESRPMIVGWLTRTLFVTSIFLLMGALLALYAGVKQVRQTQNFYAIKPAGDLYRVRVFTESQAAKAEAMRLSGIQSAGLPNMSNPISSTRK